MSEPKLGQLIEGDADRDAIHIAIIPLIAGERLHVGAKIKLKYGSTEIALRGEYNDPDEVIGIVDPWLEEYSIEKGQRFWAVLTPGTVTGMRHHWEHPKFSDVSPTINEHEQWLREFCDRWNFNYEELIEAGTGEKDSTWRYVTARGKDLHSKNELDGNDYSDFWYHLEKLTGKEFDDNHRNDMHWSCTC